MGRRAGSRRPPRSARAEDPRLCRHCHHAGRLLGAGGHGAGGSLTWGWAKGGDSRACGGTGAGRKPPCATVLAASPSPAHGRRYKRTFHAPLEYRQGHPDTLAGTRAWQPAGQHPEGFRGCTQYSAPDRAVPQLGVAPSHPCRRHLQIPLAPPHPSGTSAPLPAPPALDKRLKVQLCQLPHWAGQVR